MNSVWLNWLRGLFWAPPRDDRLAKIEAETASIQQDIAALKERTAALEDTASEAFRRLAGDAEQ